MNDEASPVFDELYDTILTCQILTSEPFHVFGELNAAILTGQPLNSDVLSITTLVSKHLSVRIESRSQQSDNELPSRLVWEMRGMPVR